MLTPDELSACMVLAGQLHPAWERCSQTVRKVHAHNIATLLSSQLDRPVHVVLCWSPGAAITGGTGMALRIAAAHGIPVMNLGALSPRAACECLLAIRGDDTTRPTASTHRA